MVIITEANFFRIGNCSSNPPPANIAGKFNPT